jgi:A/G-specific adenine glycosylase
VTPSAHHLHAPVTDWYRANARDLPWRRVDRTPWGVLVSEVMLQQTPVARVVPVWTDWMRRWPTPAALAAAPVADAIRGWGRLGYPRRALRLHEAAETVTERHGGAVPDRVEDLLALPGIGAYTAAAVATFAFGQRHAVVDTNVRRFLARAVAGAALPAPALTAAETRLAVDLVPASPDLAVTWAAGSMELGALVCTARSPRCQDCPVRDSCRWRSLGSPAHDGPPRRGQAYAGTDRYVRGLLLAALREADGPLPRSALVRAAPDPLLRDPGQRDRCLHTLVVDGLVEPRDDGFALPTRR